MEICTHNLTSSLNWKWPEASHVFFIEGVTTTSFNKWSSHEVLLLSFLLQRGEDLTVFPPEFVDLETGNLVFCPQVFETPPLVLAKMWFALKVAHNRSGSFCWDRNIRLANLEIKPLFIVFWVKGACDECSCSLYPFEKCLLHYFAGTSLLATSSTRRTKDWGPIDF